MGFVDTPVRVRVPATSANLGPGFDALGLALGLHDELVAQVVPEGLHVEVDGEGGAGNNQVARDESHLVIRAMRRTFERLGDTPRGLSVHCTNTIPHSRGLGSSAAAIVAGIVLARALCTHGERLTDADALTLACEIEGHPDNVAPCLVGGLTVAWTDRAGAHAVRRDLDPQIVPVALVPPTTASTELARGLLPLTVPHGDAAFVAGRAALLVAALTGSPEALLPATEDRLHQSFRAPAMPESALLVKRLRLAGHAAVISGAGPTVLVLARGQVEAEAVSTQVPADWTVHTLQVDTAGATVITDAES